MHRHHHLQGPGPYAVADASHRASRHRLRAREPRHLSDADGRGKPCAGLESTLGDRMEVRGHVPFVPAPERAPLNSGGRAFRRRTADAYAGAHDDGNPELVIIDEPTEGLAPMIVTLVADFLRELKGRGTSILLIEQKLTIALEISQRVYVMGHGHMVFEGTPDQLRKNKLVRQEWLEV